MFKEIRNHFQKRFRSEYLGQRKQQTSGQYKDVKLLSVNDMVFAESEQKRTFNRDKRHRHFVFTGSEPAAW